jgi:UDP-N-acetylglucosamine 2-epimerase
MMKFRICFQAALGVLMSLSAFAQQPPAERRAPQPIPLFFRETWRDTAAIPVTQAAVSNPDLELRIYGASKDDMTVNNEGGVPHVWTGLCPAGCAVVLRHKESLVDLTGKARIKWYTKPRALRRGAIFFDELELPKHDLDLGVASASHAFQTAEVLKGFEPIVKREAPAFILVVGDVNSTMAAALVAAKEQVPLIHVEAGLRSFDRAMPEEVNRIVTDALSDLLFVTEEGAIANLLKEGVAREKIHFVGNVMIDMLLHHRDRARRSTILEEVGLTERGYGVVTLHRPSNVDHVETFQEIITAIVEVSSDLPILFPCHPRLRRCARACCSPILSGTSTSCGSPTARRSSSPTPAASRRSRPHSGSPA